MGDAPAVSVPVVTLSSSAGSRSMPVIGYGTAVEDLTSVPMKANVLEAIKLGYRHFDTAALYRSEQAVGEAIAEALKLGLVSSRDELFITSKLFCNGAHPDLVVPSLRQSLERLQLEYIDLYLIHYPLSSKPGDMVFPIPPEDLMPMDFKGVWEGMEECQRLGLTKAIGVSNFASKKLEHILSFAKIPPSVNQVEFSPIWQQRKLLDLCKANGIVLTGFSPLGAKKDSWGTNLIMDNEVLQEIAKAHGKTVAQIALRWIIELGQTLVVKSLNTERMKQNLEIFDWELTVDDHKKINQIPQTRFMLFRFFITPNGPYKSLEELWDGEL